MSETKSEILVEIPDGQLLKLATLYAKKAFWAPYMVTFISMVVKWKKSAKLRNIPKITSPNSTWEKDGTIIAFLQFELNADVILFTLDEKCTNLYEGLMKTDLIDYQKRVVFYGVHEKHISAVNKYLQNKKINVSLKIPCHYYSIHPEDAISTITIDCPPDVYIKKLSPSNAKQVNAVWPHRFPGSEAYIGTFIETNGGYGVFLKSTNELVAWVLKHVWGQLGMLQAEESHRRKGYGSLVTKVLSKEIAEEGYWPLGTIQFNNCPAKNMFEKMEFYSMGTCMCIIIQEPCNK